MLRPIFLSLMLSAVAVPAMAQDIKQEVEKVRAAYQECVGKHDAACVAALYSKDGVQINPGGIFSDLKKTYEDNFKSGDDSVVIRTDEIWVINNDLALAKGEADISRNPRSAQGQRVLVGHVCAGKWPDENLHADRGMRPAGQGSQRRQEVNQIGDAELIPRRPQWE